MMDDPEKLSRKDSVNPFTNDQTMMGTASISLGDGKYVGQLTT